VAVVSEAVTGAPESARQLRVRRGADGRTLHVAGSLPAGGDPFSTRVAVTDNTRYFVTVLREALATAGIAMVDAPAGTALPGTVPAGADTLFVHVSPPLREILPHFMKPSQNQIGEILLKTLGAELRGTGTAAAGVAVVDSLLRASGLPHALLRQADGSGLSRYNIVAPVLLVDLLDREQRSPRFADFLASMPVAGVDGTLAGRMRGTPLEGNVRAKTGTLNNVRALSGYMETAAGERIIFSMLVNHHSLTAADADRLAEAALLRLHALPRAIIMATPAPR
jgi:serine-type D-Ala-D-Ala carboxypeptidase/endopeptidase (penicillin-binding protein 4)